MSNVAYLTNIEEVQEQEERYVTFNKEVMYVENDKGDRVDIPAYVARAYKRYRYDNREKVIEKQCVECQTWYPVLKLEKDRFVDIHSEEQIHFQGNKSGFAVRCQICLNSNESKTIVSKKQIEKKQKYSVFLTKRNKEYLQMRARLENRTIADILNQIIEKERKEKPLMSFLKNLEQKLES